MDLGTLVSLLDDSLGELQKARAESLCNLEEGRLALFQRTEDSLVEIRGNMDKVMGIAGQGAARGMWALPSSFSKYKEALDAPELSEVVKSASDTPPGSGGSDLVGSTAPDLREGTGPGGASWAVEELEEGGGEGGGLRLCLSVPEAESAASIDFEAVSEWRLSVDAGAGRFEIPLPARVAAEECRAKFSKKRRELAVFMPPPAAPAAAPAAALALGPGAGRAARAAEHAAQSLQDRHYAVLDDFLPPETARALLGQVEVMRAGGELGAGEVAGGLKRDVRGDEMAYLSPAKTRGALLDHAGHVDRLVLGMMGRVGELQGVALIRDKAMVACYPGGGAQYVLHTDNPDGSNARVLTFILYLNPSWAPHAGGALEVHAKGRVVEVQPRYNRLAVFWSDGRCPHRVTPAFTPRYGVSFWYYDGDKVSEEMAGVEGRVKAASAKVDASEPPRSIT